MECNLPHFDHIFHSLHGTERSLDSKKTLTDGSNAPWPHKHTMVMSIKKLWWKIYKVQVISTLWYIEMLNLIWCLYSYRT